MSTLTFNYGYWEFWSPYDPVNAAYGNHKCIFDGENKKIYVNPAESEVDVKINLYSDWKEWVSVRDNAKFLPAIRTTGGDPIGGGQFTGDTYFLINGWQVIIDHFVDFNGILFSDDYDSPFVILAGGGVNSTVSSLAIAYNTTGSSGSSVTPEEIWAYQNRTLTSAPVYDGPSTQDIADAVRVELTPELSKIMTLENNPGLTQSQATMLLEMYELLGLDPTKPLMVTTNSRTAGDISQAIITDSNSTIVTRV